MANAAEYGLTRKHGPYDGLAVMETGAGYKSSKKIREITINCAEYYGVDQQEGIYVDIIHDLEYPMPAFNNGIDVVLCYSVLEHSARPWRVAENIQAVLRKGGLLLISVPFSFKYHAYPKDYYRFTFDALDYLFPSIEWTERHTWPEGINIAQHPKESIILLAAGRKI